MARTTKRDGRKVSPLVAPLVQPGAVAAALAPTETGRPLAADVAVTEHEYTAEQMQRRDAFITLARQRFRQSADAEHTLRENMLADLKFYNSDQWPDHIKRSRALDERPCLTINRLPQFVRQVVNQARQSKPAIQVNPVDNGADPDTAEVLQGMCRHIETQSKAHIAYSTGNEHQAIMGRGFWRVLTEYAADDSFEQEIRIRRVQDPFTVYPDPSCSEPDYSDGLFCFLIERVHRSEYRRRYGDRAASEAHHFQSIGDQRPVWMDGDWIQVAEYFYVEHTRQRIADVVVLPGTDKEARITMLRSALKARDFEINPSTGAPYNIIVAERDTLMRTVKWALINGVEVLEGNPEKTEGRALPGRYIPVIPVLGEELVVDGEKNLRGMVRDAQSPQRAYNFWVSAMTEKLALGTKAPIIAAMGQLEGHEGKWNQANKRNFAYLEYNPIDVSGNLVPPPQRAGYDPDITAALMLTQQADRDLKSVLGMFDASQEKSQEQSGKAILARQAQGEQGTSHFLDNLSRSIEHTGRILLDWIPVYYDKPRMLRVNGLDDLPSDVLIHAGNGDAAQQMLDKEPDLAKNIKSGRPFDLGVGRYDVSISVGPSYASRRQESVEAIIQLVQAYPALLPVVGDILMENMDWPGAKQLAPRLKRLVPPEAKDPEDGEQEIPPELRAQMQQMQQQLEAALEALAEKDQIIESKAQELAAKGEIEMAKMESQERLAAIKAQAEMAKTLAQINADKAIALLDAKMKEITQRLDHTFQRDRMKAESKMPAKSAGGGRSPAAARRK